MKDLKLIDCSACIGLGGINRQIVNHEDYIVTERVREPANAAELLEEMDFCGIDEAVVYHQSMVDVSPQYGNSVLLSDKRNYTGRLRATITVAPSVSDVEFEIGKIVQTAKEFNLAGVRAFPQLNRYRLDRVTCGDLLDYLSGSGLPLYLSPMDNWDYIFETLKEFPDLTVILTNYGLWGSDRYFYPLVRAYKNVYVDTSDFQEIRGIEAFVNKFGGGRMLFGTNFPMDNMGGPATTLFCAKISDDAREDIAHRNIERLLAEVKL